MSSRLPARWAPLLTAAIAGAACADLAPIEPGTCGNQVLDPGEDCDRFADDALGSDLACGRPPADPAGASDAERERACHYVCGDDVACPDSWDCGRDGVCRRPSREDLVDELLAPGWTPDSFVPVDLDGDGDVDVVGAFPSRIEFRRGAPGAPLAASETASTLPASGPLASGSLDGDAFGDVVLPTSEGMLLWRGRGDGTPLESAGAGRELTLDFSALLVGATRQHVHGSESALQVVVDQETSTALVLFSPGGQLLAARDLAGPCRVRDLGSRLPRADFDGDGNDDYVIACRGAARVEINRIIVSPLDSSLEFASLLGGGDGSIRVDQPRECAACETRRDGMRVAGGAMGADVDGDGDVDLLVSVADEVGVDATLVALNEDGISMGTRTWTRASTCWPIAAAPRAPRASTRTGRCSPPT